MLVYCVVGLPRTGSTFVGDWLARRVGAVNVGETWQTFRTMELVNDPRFESRQGKWARPDRRAAKAQDIMRSPFWNRVISSGAHDPYRALLDAVGQWSDVAVDCSKVEQALSRYLALGCDVRVVHTARSFSTWTRSIRRYQERDGIPRASPFRLLLSYMRTNRALARWRGVLPYRVVLHEDLAMLDRVLTADFMPPPKRRRYERVEMFGTPGFTTAYDPGRAAVAVARYDRLIYSLAGVRK